MIEVLKNKNATTKMQIMVEIAGSGPNVQQREIAKSLEITPQAVSDYIGQLVGDKMLVSEGRSVYRVTNEGVNWIIKMLRDLSGYTEHIQKAVTDISVCAAMAEDDLEAGQKVGLKMKDGLLIATKSTARRAAAIAVSGAAAGDEVGVTGIEGIVPLRIGKVTILRVPAVQHGGSNRVDPARLRSFLKKSQFTVSLGLEAFAALRKNGADFCRYGATEAAIEAARSGIAPLVVCVENETSGLIARLEKEKIAYEIADAAA